MEMQQLQSGLRTERKKDLYILSLDGGRMFWVVSISLLLLVFLFLLGYWIGHDTVPARQGTALDQTVSQNPASREMGLESRDMSGLRQDFERIGQTRSPIIDERATAPTESAGVEKKDEGGELARLTSRVGRESEKPRIDETGLATKSEKKEFETLRTKPKKQPTQPPREAAPAKGKKASRQDVVPVGKYQVQVASFSSRSGAETLVRRLQEKRYQANIVTTTVQGKEYFRVRVGGYESYDAASRVVANLKSSGEGSGSYIVQR